MAKKQGVQKKRKVIVEAIGQAHIHSSFNNITFSSTCGVWGFADTISFWRNSEYIFSDRFDYVNRTGNEECDSDC